MLSRRIGVCALMLARNYLSPYTSKKEQSGGEPRFEVN